MTFEIGPLALIAIVVCAGAFILYVYRRWVIPQEYIDKITEDILLSREQERKGK